jgi:hypothetical protein
VSSYFPDATEIRNCPSFLAVSIPSLLLGDNADNDEHGLPKREPIPYGVIRVVRDKNDPFNAGDKRFAELLAQRFSRWVSAFPANHDLKIQWFPDEAEKRAFLENLFHVAFDAPDDHEVKIEKEFTFLLKKIFVNCSQIKLSRLLSGGSGASVVLIRNDFGQDLILKCCRVTRGPVQSSTTPPSGTPDVFRDGSDPISAEISNYTKYIEGRLPLYHNVIYPNLIRETWHLKGFATSLVSTPTGARISLTDYCTNALRGVEDVEDKIGRLDDLEAQISHVVRIFFGRVWAYWYQQARLPQEPKSSGKLSDLLNTELGGKDGVFFGLLEVVLPRWRNSIRLIFSRYVTS